jgi:hypothetical protein
MCFFAFYILHGSGVLCCGGGIWIVLQVVTSFSSLLQVRSSTIFLSMGWVSLALRVYRWHFVLHCLGHESVVEFLSVFDICGCGDVSEVAFKCFYELWPVCCSEVSSWGPCCFWCVYVDLGHDWVVIRFHWPCCVICVTSDNCVHDVFCTKDVVDSCVVA